MVSTDNNKHKHNHSLRELTLYINWHKEYHYHPLTNLAASESETCSGREVGSVYESIKTLDNNEPS